MRWPVDADVLVPNPPTPRPSRLCRYGKGPVGGVNTNLTADGNPASSWLLGRSWGGRAEAGRLEARYSGKLVRVDLDDFSPTGVQVPPPSVPPSQTRGPPSDTLP